MPVNSRSCLYSHLISSSKISNQDTGYTVTLDLCEDRGAQWSLTADDEIGPGAPAALIAGIITRVLQVASPNTE